VFDSGQQTGYVSPITRKAREENKGDNVSKQMSGFEYGLADAKVQEHAVSYAKSHDYRSDPLSGEWAGDILSNDILRTVDLDPDTIDPDDAEALISSWLYEYESFWL